MKKQLILFVAIIVIVLVGIILWGNALNSPRTTSSDESLLETERKDTTEQNIDSTEQEEGVINSTDTAVEDHGDVGMEFPTIDGDIVLEAGPSTKRFTIAGVNHRFDTKEIRVKQGDTVTINFTSEDGFHDWVIDEFDAATAKVRPGTPTSVTFVADKKGTFEYYCSVSDHREQGMVGSLIVE